MSEITRNPTGHGETATVLTLCLSLGMYLGSLVDDPNLTNFIIGATTLGGKFLQTFLSNLLGAPLASMIGARAMNGAKLGVVLLAMWLPLGCNGYVSAQGLGWNAGNGSLNTCGPGEIEGENCTVLKGAGISVPFAGLLTGIVDIGLNIMGRFIGPMGAAPVPAPAPDLPTAPGPAPESMSGPAPPDEPPAP